MVEKPLSEFSKLKSSPDGRQPMCKACHKVYNALPEQVAKRKAKQEAGKADPKLLEQERQRGREKYARLYAQPRTPKTPEELKEARAVKWQKRVSSLEAREADARRKAEWNARPEVKARKDALRATPEGRARHNAKSHRRRARALAAEGNHTGDEVLAILELQGGLCYYCPNDLGRGFEVDHYIPLAVGGANDATNLVLACRPCNRKKANSLPWKFDPSIPSTQLTPR